MMRLKITLSSTTLLKPVEVVAAVPYSFGSVDPPFRAVWALHCAMGSGDFFFEVLNASGIVDKENIVIIAPSLGNGYFINSPYERQADFLQELLESMRGILPLSHARVDNALVGVSMGGFGAVRWALDSEYFGSMTAISGVFDCQLPIDNRIMKNRGQRALHATFKKVMAQLLLDDTGKTRPDADFNLLFQKKQRSFLPQLNLYCGGQDYLSLPHTMELKRLCDHYGCPVALNISDGGHDAAYWQRAFMDAVPAFFRHTGQEI